MMVLPMQAGFRYAPPRDNLHIVPHYQKYRALRGMHIAHHAIGLLSQFQELFVFVDQAEKQVVQVVRRSRSVMSYCPLYRFYCFLYQSLRLTYTVKYESAQHSVIPITYIILFDEVDYIKRLIIILTIIK